MTQLFQRPLELHALAFTDWLASPADALGYDREAEAAFRNNVLGFLDAGLYKDAFLTVMTRVDLLLRREEPDKAAHACEEALVRIEEAGVSGHATITELWRAFLALVRERALTASHMLEVRHYLVRWGAGHRQSPKSSALQLPAWVKGAEAPEPANAPELPTAVNIANPGRLVAADPPDPATSLAELGYKGALEQYGRQVIAAALAQSQGRIGEAGRLLGLSPVSLRAKLKGFLAGGEE